MDKSVHGGALGGNRAPLGLFPQTLEGTYSKDLVLADTGSCSSIQDLFQDNILQGN